MRSLRTLLIAAAVAVAPPVLAQELKVGLAAEPSAMDPHFHNLTPNSAMLSHIFERLVETDPQNKLVPGLAEGWRTVNETTCEFRLRKGV
jgi:peptide/nickel transport system substrate-binding protein